MKQGIALHGGLVYITSITQVFHIFIFFITILILLLTSFLPIKLWTPKFSLLKKIMGSNDLFLKKIKIINNRDQHLKIIEYPLIILFIISGAVFLISTNDLITVFLSIELQSYGLYILSTIYRNSELSTTGGLIYFLLGGLSSCFILLGISLLYANSGTTNIDGFYIITSISDLDNINYSYKSYYIQFSLLIFSIGFLFKVGAAPFHFWSPDVYDAIPTIVTTFVAIVAKISIFIFLLELVYYTSSYFINFNWTFGLLISSLLSLIIGTIGGLTQFRIKRLFAYSTISHIGFILLALSISTIESTQAFIFYLIQYSISNLNIFFILVTIGFSLSFYYSNNKEYNDLLDKHNSPIQLISQLKGYFYLNPMLALSLTITIFSFIGIPPLVGFFAKQMVLSAALDKGYFFLVLIAIITSVISAGYYLNIIKEIFFFNPDYIDINKIKNYFWLRYKLLKEKNNTYLNNNKLFLDLNDLYVNKVQNPHINSTIKSTPIYLSSVMAIIISIITLIILLFIFINKEWINLGTILVQILFNN
jgi:NADH-ubiquinone oxidoreductase chain 2